MSTAGAAESLRSALEGVEHRIGGAEGATVDDLVRPLGHQGVALAAALLVLPGLSPVSLGPLSSLVGLLTAAAGVQLALGREHLHLPDRLRRVRIGAAAHARMRSALARACRILERLPPGGPALLVRGRTGRVLCGGGIVAAAGVLALPFPFLPLSNTLPAIAVLLFSIGWAERNGWMAAAAMVTLAASAALAAGYVRVALALLPG